MPKGNAWFYFKEISRYFTKKTNVIKSDNDCS